MIDDRLHPLLLKVGVVSDIGIVRIIVLDRLIGGFQYPVAGISRPTISAPDNRWNNNNLNLLKSITGSDFEVVQMGAVYTDTNVPTVRRRPSAVSVRVSSVTCGTPVTLSWNVTNSLYNIILLHCVGGHKQLQLTSPAQQAK